MKNTIRLWAFVAVAVGLAFASCQKEDNSNNSGAAPQSHPVPDGYVDLGLPSGLLWSKCNLGATSPEEYGGYYAWGETATKEVYDWRTYRYCNGYYTQLTKYCNNSSYGYNGFTDNLTTLEAMDDAATAALGDSARMPTKEEWRELINNTTMEWTSMNGVNGRQFTAANGCSLFLPAAGERVDCELRDAGSKGYYWFSSLVADRPEQDCAEGFCIFSGGSGQYFIGTYRKNGLSVRPVRSAR